MSSKVGTIYTLKTFSNWNLVNFLTSRELSYCCIQSHMCEMLFAGNHSLTRTVPLVSYIKNSIRLWYYASLSTCCQNVKKNWGHRENLGESWPQTLKGSDREKCQFEYFVNFQRYNFAIFLWRGSMNEISLIGEKKFMITEEKVGKMTTVWGDNLPSWA